MSGVRKQVFFGATLEIQEYNSYGLTELDMDLLFPDRLPRSTPDKNLHICWYRKCKSKAASERCRICGDCRHFF
jgi:hypothetical protein